MARVTVDPLVSLLVGALGAALLGLLGAWIQSRREHARWIREQRLAAYLDYIRLIERMPYLTKVDEETLAFIDSLTASVATLRLVGPRAVFDAGVALSQAAIRDAGFSSEPGIERDPKMAGFKTARDTLVAAAQRELGIRP